MKMYVVVRSDMPVGSQAVQAGHALQEMNIHHHDLVRHWYQVSNTLVYLSIKNEDELLELWRTLDARGIKSVPFREPDMDNALTAVAFEPEAQPHLQGLRLAFT